MQHCVTGRHAWLDPVSAKRCCTGLFDRQMFPQDRIPAHALPDGRVHHASLPFVYVWLPRFTPRKDA